MQCAPAPCSAHLQVRRLEHSRRLWRIATAAAAAAGRGRQHLKDLLDAARQQAAQRIGAVIVAPCIISWQQQRAVGA